MSAVAYQCIHTYVHTYVSIIHTTGIPHCLPQTWCLVDSFRIDLLFGNIQGVVVLGAMLWPQPPLWCTRRLSSILSLLNPSSDMIPFDLCWSSRKLSMFHTFNYAKPLWILVPLLSISPMLAKRPPSFQSSANGGGKRELSRSMWFCLELQYVGSRLPQMAKLWASMIHFTYQAYQSTRFI